MASTAIVVKVHFVVGNYPRLADEPAGYHSELANRRESSE